MDKHLHKPEVVLYSELFKKVIPLLADYISKDDDSGEDAKVIQYKTVTEIRKCVDTKLAEKSILIKGVQCHAKTSLSSENNDDNNSGTGSKDGIVYDNLIEQVQHVLQFSCRTGHRYFMDKLYTGTDAIGTLGEVLTAILNTNVHVYSVSPVLSVLESDVIEQICCDYIGFPKDSFDGIMCPGGSYSNLLAMIVARNTMFPEIKRDGLYDFAAKGKKLIIYSSEQDHYSITKNAISMSMGSSCVRKIQTDELGRIDVIQLQKTIQDTIDQGDIPFFINATAGTTVLGAFDPLDKISKIGKKYNCWVHVDASWGGSVLVSRKYSYKIKGIDQCDSVTWNPHKALRIPLQCTFSLYRHHNVLQSSNDIDAQYLFKDNETQNNQNILITKQKEDEDFAEGNYDIGRKTIMCGRRGDVLKFWLSWLYYGREGFEYRIDKAHENVQIMAQMIKERSKSRRFLLIEQQEKYEPQFLNICFYYQTPKIRQMKPHGEQWKSALNEIAGKMYREIRKSGKIMVSTAPLPDGSPFFWRLILLNEKLGHQDLIFILDEFERIGEQM